MFREVFHLDHVQILTRISLVIFVAVFLAVLAWVYTRAKRDMNRWATLPLDEASPADLKNESKKGGAR